MAPSLIDMDDLGTSWGVLLTYKTPEERDRAINQLQEDFSSLRRHVVVEDLGDLRLSKGTVNCVDISGYSRIISGDSDTGQELMGWIKSRRIILLCKEWEWTLLQERNGRWMSHLDAVESVTDQDFSTEEAVYSLVDEERISRLPQRTVAYEYIQNRSLFTRFLQVIGADQEALQSIVEEKGLHHLDDEEQELLLYPNDAIYRYLAAHEFSSTTEFNRHEFRERFGELPFQIGFNVDTTVFNDVVNLLSDWHCTEVADFTSIETLAALLTADGFEHRLQEDLDAVLSQDIESFCESIQRLDDKDGFIKRGEFITDHIDQRDVLCSYNALLASASLERLTSDETSPVQLLERYHAVELREEDKAVVSGFLRHLIERGRWTDLNYEKTVDFLEEPGPKVVLFLDGLPLTHDTSLEYLDAKSEIERWEVGFGIAPTPSMTESFRQGLTDIYDFTQLGGFTDDDSNLAQIAIEAFLGEREGELIDLLNNDESVIIYDSGIDRSGRYPTDVGVTVDGYWTEKINEFVDRFGDYADILIVSDHGLVQTFESRAVPIPANAGKKGLGNHCRPCFVADSATAGDLQFDEGEVSMINVQIPESRENCIMLNLDNPHAKFGSQQDDRWVHGGISVEESVVPFIIRRRSP